MATKNIVPNADSEGGIGTSSKYWATGFIDAITTTGNLVIGGSIDLEGAIDVNGTTNLNIVDIDGAVNIGAEVTLAAANKIIFNDASQFIHASSNAILNLGATDEIDLTATAIDVNGTMDVSGAFTNGSTLVSTGKITADAGIDIDNINIDGTTIALSSGNLTLDVEGEIILDSNGTGTIRFNDDGTNFGMVFGDSSNFTLISKVQDKDMIFQGNDGGSTITALTLDMSEAGVATFNDDLIIKTGGTIGGASDPDLLTLSANTLTLTHANSGIFFQSVGPVNSDNSTNNFRMALYHNGANNLIPTAKTGFTAAGNAVFLGDTGVDIIIGTGNSSGAPSNSFIGLEHSGNVTMNAGASTPDIPAFKLDDADDITLTRGSLIIGTPGEGIDFTAENTGRLGGSATDRTASVLDDYEEGTWTPTFLGCSFTGTVTAKYTKIGRKVFISLFFINQTIASSSGGGGFGGLPFSKGGSSYYAPILISNADSVSSPASGFIRTHDVTMNLNVGSSVSDASWINGTNNRSMMLSGTYMV